MACLPGSLSLHAETINVMSDEKGSIQLMLANEYDDDINISHYCMSEKLDGIRAVWDGEHFYTRNGHPIIAPKWFTQGFPKLKLDGELWAGRGQFPRVQQTVLDHEPNDEDWKGIRFMAFDIVDDKQAFTFRYQWLDSVIGTTNSPYLELVTHEAILSREALFERLEEIEQGRGEGLMLRKFSSHYQSGRNDDLLKLKSYQDDEAVVIGYKPGKGRNRAQVGSLYVEWKDGKRFYLGSGLTDAQRSDPPALGSKVTFRFNGYTRSGLPRFARFVHVRVEGS
ncbi:DNA ligase [Vibrio rumoiensis 1S-45]|uniref:DNA ligase n=2 Tax=Vibrio rumoiensis TaxID=76258 RepID=A0A1E5E6P1_9VIBR|nr:DNA ligase [Vibrio rumoiensis 1S-45]